MTILIYRYGNICEPDIIRTFQEFGTQVEEICEEITEKKMTASRRVELVHNAIENCRPAMVFSINFFPTIAEVCHIHGLLYCCWTVDAPVPELYSQAITYDTNRIFLFDRSQYLEFREFQPDYTFHLPLAAAVERFDQVLGGKKDPLADSRYDISFVGSLYSEKNPLASMELPEYERGYVDALSEAAAFVYGDMYVGEFCLHLVRLVTDVPHPCVLARQHIAFALPLVSAAKYGHLAVAFEQPYQVFHMRGLARAADRDVADRDYRDVKAAAFQYAELEQLVAQPHTEAVQPA